MSPTLSTTLHPPEYYNNQQLQNIIKILNAPRADATMKAYYQMYTNRNYNYGGCQPLSGYITSEVDVTMIQNNVTGIRFSTVSSWKIYESDTPPITTVSCEISNKAYLIVKALAANKNMYTNITVSCQGNSWIVRTCPMMGLTSTSLVASSPVLCVNCNDPCSKETQCRAKGPTLVLAPCSGYVCDNDYKAIDVLSVFFKPFKASPSITQLIVTPGRQNVTVSGNITEHGIVNCGIFANETDVNIPAINVQGNSAIVSSSLSFTLVIDSLIPSSPYNLYCMTKSIDGDVAMLLEDILTTATNFTTQCCKQGD